MPRKNPAPTPPVDPLLQVAAQGYARLPEAGAFLGLSRQRLYDLMNANELAYAIFGSARRIPWASLHAYAARHTVPAVI
jgi:excisionase family DNA binding protein